MPMVARESPELSVVVASHNAGAAIGKCLDALSRQRGADRAEIIVADSSTDETPAIVRRFPCVRVLHFDEPLTIPELRGHAIAAARGGIVAVLDPFSIAAENWIDAILSAHASSPSLVIGGAVDLHDAEHQTLVTWALYINEYGLFMPPLRPGPANIMPGCNVSYKRVALFDGDVPRYGVFWKTFVNWRIQAEMPLHLAPEVVVRLFKPVSFGDFLVSRFDHGRCFAAMRPDCTVWPVRLLRAVTAPLLPPLLLWRWGRAFWSKDRNRSKLIATLPFQLLLFSVWAAGEACGYLAGGGYSCRRLFY
jgi:glycosyltransferase involved in cell wall biosynthesis